MRYTMLAAPSARYVSSVLCGRIGGGTCAMAVGFVERCGVGCQKIMYLSSRWYVPRYLFVQG